MEYRELGKTGIKTSPVCLGTWAIGGGPWWGESDDCESVKAIKASIEGGINFIDTAPAYGFGRSEEIVGKAINGMRDKVVLATKCGLWWDSDEGKPFFEMDGYTVRRSLQPETVRKELERSLKRLQTDYIDLYITHWQEPGENKTPIEVTMECLLDLKKEGKIRAIGASNTTPADIKEYLAAGQLDVVQERYTMLDRNIEPEYTELCSANSVGIMAYSVLEQGLLTGKITLESTFGDSEYRNQLPWFKPENRKKVLDMIAEWKPLTGKYQCTLSQLVIAWTFSQPGITWTLAGARKEKHARENAGACDLSLESLDVKVMREDVEALRSPE
jgi:methylglyoxal reductase